MGNFLVRTRTFWWAQETCMNTRNLLMSVIRLPASRAQIMCNNQWWPSAWDILWKWKFDRWTLVIHWTSNFYISCSEIELTEVSSGDFSYSYQELKYILSCRASFICLNQTGEMFPRWKPSINRWKISRKPETLMRHAMTLSEYRRQNRIPHGLWINTVSSFGSEFKNKWKQTLRLYCLSDDCVM